MNNAAQSPMMRTMGRALPKNYYKQEVLSAALWEAQGGGEEGRSRYNRLHRAVGVRGRYLALPMADYGDLDSFAKANDAWTRVASDLGTSAVESALSGAGLV